MGFKTQVGVSILALSSLAMIGTTQAQETPTPAAGGSSADFEVALGDFAYPLDPSDPVQGCVIAIETDQDGATSLTYRLFVREQASQGPIFNSVGIYTDNAEDFPGVEINDCFGTRKNDG